MVRVTVSVRVRVTVRVRVLVRVPVSLADLCFQAVPRPA